MYILINSDYFTKIKRTPIVFANWHDNISILESEVISESVNTAKGPERFIHVSEIIVNLIIKYMNIYMMWCIIDILYDHRGLSFFIASFQSHLDDSVILYWT